MQTRDCSRDATFQLLAKEQVLSMGARGITAAMLESRLRSSYGTTGTVDDVVRVLGNEPEVRQEIRPCADHSPAKQVRACRMLTRRLVDAGMGHGSSPRVWARLSLRLRRRQ